MSLDQPAFSQALWAGFLGRKLPRPEYLLPVLYLESGFNPAAVNSIGCTGINQACPFAWQLPSGYASWSASQQLVGVVTPMFAANIGKLGPLNSGTLAYVSNFYPVDVPKARGNLSFVIASKGSAVYNANAGLDYQHTGAIRVSDIAHFIAKAAASSAVQQAIAQAYATAPAGVGPQQDPVYGTDFPNASTSPASSSTPWLVALGLLSLGAAGYLAYREGLLKLPSLPMYASEPAPRRYRRRRRVAPARRMA